MLSHRKCKCVIYCDILWYIVIYDMTGIWPPVWKTLKYTVTLVCFPSQNFQSLKAFTAMIHRLHEAFFDFLRSKKGTTTRIHEVKNGGCCAGTKPATPLWSWFRNIKNKWSKNGKIPFHEVVNNRFPYIIWFLGAPTKDGPFLLKSCGLQGPSSAVIEPFANYQVRNGLCIYKYIIHTFHEYVVIYIYTGVYIYIYVTYIH